MAKWPDIDFYSCLINHFNHKIMKRFLCAGERYVPSKKKFVYKYISMVSLFFMCLQAAFSNETVSVTEDDRPFFTTFNSILITQETKISGVVIDTTGTPLEGVSITIRGSKVQSITDSEGRFSIIPKISSGTLMVSFVGFQTITEKFSDGNYGPYRFVLLPNSEAIEEVEINAGYYTVKDRERTGSISRITSKEIERQPVANPMAALIGRMPGVDVVQTNGAPGGGFKIQIRGRNSLRDDGNEPLYIIDGVPVPSEMKATNMINTIRPNGGPFSTLNSGDIESIEILKDADATAIYGSRGANGVVLVTTKKGQFENSESKFLFSHGIGSVESKLKLLNTVQYLEMRKEAFENDGKLPGPTDYDVNGIWDKNRYTDWQKVLLGETAHLTNTQYTLNTKEGNTSFYVGTGYSRETSVMPTKASDIKYNGVIKLSYFSKNRKFNLDINTRYEVNENNLPRVSPLRDAVMLPPNAPKIYNDDGSLNWENGTWNNPMAGFYQRYEGTVNNLLSNGTISYNIFDAINIKSSFSYNKIGNNETYNQPKISFNPYNTIGSTAYYSKGNFISWNIEPQISYSYKNALHKLSILFGSSFLRNHTEHTSLSASGFSSDALLRNPQAAASINIASINNSEYKYSAIFGRINYILLGKYLINLTGRRDGSSRFGPGRQFANFGAIGIAWQFGEEEYFVNNLKFLSQGKLRFSYGLTGNDQIGDYGYFDTWNAALYSYEGITPLKPTRLFNSEFGWEENKKMEIGIEFGLWNNKFQGSLSYYRNHSSNQLVASVLPYMTGFSYINMNFPALVQNQGLEITLGYNILSGKKINWKTDLNITFPQNKLLDFPNIEVSAYNYTYKVGKSMDIEFAYHLLGVNSKTGLYQFLDVNNDGRYTANEDYLTIKEKSKKFFGGINNSVCYKGFELNVFIQYVKQTGYSYKTLFNLAPGRQSNQPIYVLDRWQNEGDEVNVQRFTSGTGDANTLFSFRSDDRIVNSSFLKLKNVSIDYQFYLKNFKNRVALNLSAQNLAIFSKYKGLNPENSQSSTNGIPSLRMVSIGSSFTF